MSKQSTRIVFDLQEEEEKNAFREKKRKKNIHHEGFLPPQPPFARESKTSRLDWEASKMSMLLPSWIKDKCSFRIGFA